MTATTPLANVQGLQSALLASRFSGEVCFAPTVADRSMFYHYSTLMQLSAAVKAVDALAGDVLRSRALVAREAAQDREKDEAAFHTEWTKFQAILEGRGRKSAEAPGNPIEDFRAKLGDVDSRQGLVAAGLDVLSIPERVKSIVLDGLKKRGATELTIGSSRDTYFSVAFIDKGRAGTQLNIAIPQSQKILTAGILSRLLARVALATELGSFLSTGRGGILVNILPSELFKGVPHYDLECVLELREVLARSRFKECLGMVSLENGVKGVFDVSTLFQIARTIGQSEPSVGTRLYAYAAMADSSERGKESDELERTSDYNPTAYAAWRRFAEVLRKPGARTTKALVEMDVLERIIDRLDFQNDGRREWIARALAKLQVPSSEDILDSTEIKLGNRWGIYPLFTRGRGNNFRVSADGHASRYIEANVEVPRDYGPLSEDEIGLLIARALLLRGVNKMIPDSEVRAHAVISPRELAAPIPMLARNMGRVFQLGPTGLSAAKVKQLTDFHSWVAMWSMILTHAFSNLEGSLRNELAKLKVAPSIERHSPQILSLLGVPNTDQILVRQMGAMRSINSSFVFKMLPSTGSGTMHITSNDYANRRSANITIPSSVLSDLKIEDLLDIFFRASLGDRLSSQFKDGITTRQLRAGIGLSPDMLLQRSAFLLMFAYKQLAHKEPEGICIDASEGIVLAGKRLARSIAAVGAFSASTQWEAHQVAWQGTMNVRRWYIQGAGLYDDNFVDVIPVGNIALVHVHGDADKLSPTDWLYIMSVMAANPTMAIKLHTGNRNVTVGNASDANDLYGVIAANRIFASFGVFDADAKPPRGVAFRFPGGVQPSSNPHFAGASLEKRQKYIGALRWFALADMPPEWKPTASDTENDVKRKWKRMNRSWHPDMNPKLREEALRLTSVEHWDAVMDIYQKEVEV